MMHSQALRAIAALRAAARSCRGPAAAAAMTLAAAHSATAGTIVLLDETFAVGDWTASIVDSLGNGGTVSTNQSGDGNPGFARSVKHVVNGAVSASQSSTIRVFHRSSALSYDPGTNGAIATLDFSMLDRHVSAFGTQRWRLAFEQAGVVYQSNASFLATTAWNESTLIGLGAADFDVVGAATGQPDLAAGGAITFGFLTENTNPNVGSTLTRTTLYDGYRLTVTTTVPEPLTAMLALVGLAACRTGALAARRRPPNGPAAGGRGSLEGCSDR